ncbi:MAG: hypothetical protein LBJ15_12800 [Comamonas sp.]|jgi:hypothetical protein|uniref:hypothetical protein n=1 Tax=Comamonas sp. TaxID=34028 RepID=UPI00281D0CE0|nr:hypothetical protein [Comamonas sp.]MDR0214873.1 hypothetical protein [Comamonas sp.]MDR2300233.1 hypothetical protein [Comamonas sp.]
MSEQTTQGNQISAVEVQQYPEHFEARVTGKVEHRVGDGPSEEIPVGTAMKVDTAIASYVLSWVDPEDQQPETAYLAKREFEHYVEVGALEVTV